jgi:hypothetical protein
MKKEKVNQQYVKIKKRGLPQLIAFAIALLLMIFPSPVMAATQAANSSGEYYVGIKVIGSDGIPVVGVVGYVVLDIACYGCGTLDTVAIATATSDPSGTMNLNLPIGAYTMQIINPAGGIYNQFDFSVPQTSAMNIRLNLDSSTVELALKANPVQMSEYAVTNTTGSGGVPNYKAWFLPNDTFAAINGIALMEAISGYQPTVPIYVMPYTTPPALLFGLAVLLIGLEPLFVRAKRPTPPRKGIQQK